MRPGREIDTQIAQEIFGYQVYPKNKVLHENAPLGERPLRKYSKEIEWAMEVAKKARVALLPIEGGQWFAFAANNEGWTNPTEMLQVLESGDFKNCGAAVSEDPAEAICQAALVAAQKKKISDAEAKLATAEAALVDEVVNPEMLN